MLNARLSIFVIAALVVVIGMISPVEMAVAQTEIIPDGEGEGGNHEGKTCPFKDKKSASINARLNI